VISSFDVAALAAIVGSGNVEHRAALAARDPGVDQENLGADVRVRPADTAEVAAVLRYCNERGIPVVPHGGRTGLSGGARSHRGGIVLSVERLDAIESLDPLSRTAVVGAGVTLARLAEAAGAHALSVGTDLGARDSATLGGMVSTNAGGIGAFRHGTVRERVLGLEAVLADGSIVSELGRVLKRNEGYGVERLLIGAEGTLGVITRVSLALVAADGPGATALVAVDSLVQAVSVADRLRRSTNATAIELMSGNHAAAVCRSLGYTDLAPMAAHPWLLLLEVGADDATAAESALVGFLEPLLEDATVADAAIAQNASQRDAMWRVREDWAVDRERPGGLWFDVSVPLSELSHYVDVVQTRVSAHDPTLGVYIIGHLGDGNLHVTINAPTPITERYATIAPLVTEGLAECGGSWSAEHGIGIEKKSTLERLAGATKQRLMRALKDVYDPNGILNPGKVVPG
jgi:FAD/FMN-containing dehydrogenase